MKAVTSRMTRALNHGTWVETCDNSGAKILKIMTVNRHKTVKGRVPQAAVADLVMCSVKSGKPDMRKQVVYAIIVRQKKAWRRKDGTRICFEDNAAVVVKDKDGNPKGTVIKGPIAKEVADRWPLLAKNASLIV
ncbi:MAG: 50S ribosomal protein L14 [Nanoarchaeota archaeon]